MRACLRMAIGLALGIGFAVGAEGVLAQESEDSRNRCSFMQPDTANIGGTPARALQILRSQGGAKAILLASVKDGDETQVNVNSDGSPRAYHLLDPEGRKYALNDMYSGGTRVFENGEEIAWCATMSDDERRRQRIRYYEVFARFVKENANFGVAASTYNPKRDSTYKVGDDFGNGLDAPPGLSFSFLKDVLASILQTFPSSEPKACPQRQPPDEDAFNCLPCTATNCRVCFKRSIISSEPSGKLCIRKSGRYVGFLVNQTSLDAYAANAPDRENAEDDTCQTPVNVDPEKLPGIVLPGGSIMADGDPELKGSIGDVVVAYNPRSDKWAFGIVSDGGPAGKVGEASIAFNRILQVGYRNGALSARPVAYHPDLLNSTFQPYRPIVMLLLPGSKALFRKSGLSSDNKAFDFSPANVARTAKAAFLGWAGAADIEAARKKFAECAGEFKK